MKKHNLDVKDQKLIKVLEEDGRASFTQIAKKIGVSKEVAQYRFNRLVDKKILVRQYLLVDHAALGQRLYRFLIDLHNIGKDTRNKIVSYLRSLPNVDINVFVQGRNDIEIYLYISAAEDFYDFYEAFIEQFSEYISQKQLSIVSHQHYLGHRYLYGNKKSVLLGKGREIKVDPIDLQILNILKDNVRIQVIDIAKQVNLSSSAVLYRLRKILKEPVLGYGVVLNKKHTQINSYRINLTLNDLSKKQELIKYLSKRAEVTKINELIGEMDVGFEMDVTNIAELDEFLDKIRAETNFIRDFSVIPIVFD